ncbi:MAG TPA: tyrosine-type recombinase/integrase [Chthoniobacterales bacterium]|jgi:integrase
MNMQQKYRSFQRQGGVFYWQENGTSKRGSLKTKDRAEAERLLLAMNEAHKQPTMNLALGRAYLSAHDPQLITRTLQVVMDEMAEHGILATRFRCKSAFSSRAFDTIRRKALVETKAEDFLSICHKNGNSINHYLRRLHNLALNLGWLAWPVLHKAVWQKIKCISKRAITTNEHAAIIASEQNTERKAFYQLLYETGAAQTDAANLNAKQIDWRMGVLVYRRQKLGDRSEPARLSIGKTLRELLLTLPSFGDLFPNIKNSGANARASEFSRRCRIAGVKGVSLHSYRHSWAQRAKSCGYPQRFTQEALGHGSRASMRFMHVGRRLSVQLSTSMKRGA